MSIFDEVQQMEHLTVIGKALIKYSMSIEPGLVFERNSVGWVPNDERNFVGFRFQWTDSLSITISLFGSPEEHFVQDDIEIKKGKCHNSLARITENKQLMAASVSIWRAHQLFVRGSNRDRRALLLIDELSPGTDGPWLPPRFDDNGLLRGDGSIEQPGDVEDVTDPRKLIDSSFS